MTDKELDDAVRRLLKPQKRERSPDHFRNMLAFVLVGAFIAVLPLLVWKTIPEPNKDIIVYLIGQLSGMALMALGFYFTNKAGQDAADAKKADNSAKAFEAITATAQASPATTAVKAANEVADAAATKADEIEGIR